MLYEVRVCKKCGISFQPTTRQQWCCSKRCRYRHRCLTLAIIWKKVDKHTSDRGCWLWTGATDKDGYGKVGKGDRAHRYMFTLLAGAIPKGKCICHICDTPACVNPWHLYAGTSLQNKQDALCRGRIFHPVGTKCPAAKLTWEVVRAIRTAYLTGHHSQGILAHQYGVSQSTIGFIVRGKTWVEDAPLGTSDDAQHRGRIFLQRGEHHANAKLTWEQVREMRARYAPGQVTYKTLAIEYHVSPALIAAIIQGRAWQEVA